MSNTDKPKDKIKLPPALSPETAEKLVGDKGRALYAAVAVAGGFGNISESGFLPALDLQGLPEKNRPAVEKIFADFTK